MADETHLAVGGDMKSNRDGLSLCTMRNVMSTLHEKKGCIFTCTWGKILVVDSDVEVRIGSLHGGGPRMMGV